MILLYMAFYARNKGGKYCTWHYISYKALYQLVFEDILSLTILLKTDREAFQTMLQKHLNTQNKQQLAAIKKEQGKLQIRLDELGKIIKKLYEDNALSRISDDEYTRFSAEFISERQQAEQRLTAITAELAQQEHSLKNAEQFTALAASMKSSSDSIPHSSCFFVYPRHHPKILRFDRMPPWHRYLSTKKLPIRIRPV